MPRIKLSEKSSYCFSTLCRVRVDDINYGNHLDNARLVSFLHETRVRFFRELGADEGNLGDGETGIVMGDLSVNYKAEVFYGNELAVECEIDEIESMSFRMFYRIRNNGALSALAETGIVGFNYKKRSIAEIPDSFIQSLNSYRARKI